MNKKVFILLTVLSWLGSCKAEDISVNKSLSGYYLQADTDNKFQRFYFPVWGTIGLIRI